jgi:hypothetical protein
VHDAFLSFPVYAGNNSINYKYDLTNGHKRRASSSACTEPSHMKRSKNLLAFFLRKGGLAPASASIDAYSVLLLYSRVKDLQSITSWVV